MNQQMRFQHRTNSNKILFNFDSLLDLHLAVVYALQKEYPSGGSNPRINYSFLHQSHKDLRQFRVFGIGKNVVQECFNEPIKSNFKTIYDTYINDRFDEIIGLAPLTSSLKVIAAYTRVGHGKLVKPFIFCKNIKEERIAKAMIKSLPVKIIRDDPKNIMLDEYARFVIGDVRDLDDFNAPQCVYIAVLNYGDNLQIVRGQPVIIPKYVMEYGDVNEFQIFDSYTNVTVPESMKKENAEL